MKVQLVTTTAAEYVIFW